MYKKFALVILINVVVMFLIAYVFIDDITHVYFSINKTYMTLLMTMPMAILMLLIMRSMFENKKLNYILLAGAGGLFVLVFLLARNQAPIGNEMFLRAMIPHHSQAILACQRSNITDPEVAKLCEKIVKAQEEEIAQMSALLAHRAGNGASTLAEVPSGVDRAEGLFIKNCADCHHDTADGHGSHAQTMHPPFPANLTLIRNTPAMSQSIIINGIPGTMMPPHADFSSQDLEDLLGFISRKPQNTKIQWDIPWAVVDSKDPETGKKLFTTYCAGCHEHKSRFANNPLVWPKPAHLHSRNSVPGRIYYIITRGREGTMMTSNEKLTESARWLLAQHVAGLFDAESKSTIELPENKISSVANPYRIDNKQIVREGETFYNLYCAVCHSEQGEGSFQAPMLCDRNWHAGDGSDAALMAILQEGIPGKLMIATSPQLSDDQRWKLITWIRHRGGLPNPMTTLFGSSKSKH